MIGSTQSHLEVGLVAQSQDLLFVAEIGKIALVPRRPEVRLLTRRESLETCLPGPSTFAKSLQMKKGCGGPLRGIHSSLELTFNIKDADGSRDLQEGVGVWESHLKHQRSPSFLEVSPLPPFVELRTLSSSDR